VSAPPSAYTSTLVVLALIVYLIVRRTVAQIRGARYSTGRLIVFASFYVLLFVVLGATTLWVAYTVGGTAGLLLLAPYAAAVAVPAWVTAPYVQRIVKFETRESGERYYRLPPFVPVLYLGLFVVRFAFELVLFGPSLTLPTSFPPGLLDTLVGLDLLYGGSTGLLIGRSVGVYRAHAALRPPPAEPPLPSGSSR